MVIKMFMLIESGDWENTKSLLNETEEKCLERSSSAPPKFLMTVTRADDLTVPRQLLYTIELLTPFPGALTSLSHSVIQLNEPFNRREAFSGSGHGCVESHVSSAYC